MTLDIEEIGNQRIPRFSWDYEDCSEADHWFLMAKANQECCVYLLEEMIAEKVNDTFHHAKVSVSIMEHAMELFIKGSISQSKKDIPMHHHLDQLFAQYKNLYPGERFKFTCAVDELVQSSPQTPHNQYARYPTDLSNRPWRGNTHIDLAIWYVEAFKLLDDFRRLEPLIKAKYPNKSTSL